MRRTTAIAAVSIAAVSALAGAHPAAAHQPGAAAPTPTERCQLALVGDSSALGLAAPLAAAVDGDRCEVVMRWNFGPLSPDTEARLAPVLASRPDVVVLAFGPWEEAHLRLGHVLDPADPDWPAEYRRHLESWIGGLRESGARVAWVGMHRTRDEEQSRATGELNTIWEGIVAADPTMAWVDGRAALAGPGGRYLEIDSSVEPPVRLVGRDGIHVCREGATRLARSVVGVLADEFGVAIRPEWERSWSNRDADDAATCPVAQTLDSFRRFFSLAFR